MSYDKLRTLARQLLNQQPAGHTLQPTALVHEAYVRLAKRHNNHAIENLDPKRFYFLAAKVMRSVLVDHARRRRAQKRHGEGHRVPLDHAVATYERTALDLVALDEALIRLEVIDYRLARMVDLRFFCGLSVEETADALGVSERTVRREWQTAKAWLNQELRGTDRAP